MLIKFFPYIIIGGGPAGIAAVNYLSSYIPSEEILLITEEKQLYNRIYLVDYIFNKVKFEEIFFSVTNKCKLLTSTKIVNIFPFKKFIVDNFGNKYKYHYLFLATGSIPALPSKRDYSLLQYENISTLKNLQDAEKIKKMIPSVEHITILGCGAIGLELFSGICQTYPNKKVLVIEKDGYPIPSILDKKSGKLLYQEIKNVCKNKNYKLVFNSMINSINQNKKIFLTLSNGEKVYTDFLIFATGVKPVSPFRKKLVINKYCETEFEYIYAGGDAVKFNNCYYPNYLNAIHTGIIAAKNILGEKAEIENYTQTNILEIFDFIIVANRFFPKKIGEKCLLKKNNIINYSFKEGTNIISREELLRYFLCKKYKNLVGYNLQFNLLLKKSLR